MRHRLSAATAALALLALAGPAAAQSDTEGDGSMDRETFAGSESVGKTFDSWDSNADGLLSQEEFGNGIYDYYDADGDGSLDPDEMEGVTDEEDGLLTF